jgi:hypothetical protein
MIRRDFFKALAAATAALYATKGTAIAVAPPPRPAETMLLTPPPPPKAENPQQWIRDLLEKCVVVGYSSNMTAGNLRVMDVEYIYDPEGRWRGARLNDELRQWLPEKAGIRSVNVSTAVKSVDITMPWGRGWKVQPSADDVEHRIEVEWICPA